MMTPDALRGLNSAERDPLFSTALNRSFDNGLYPDDQVENEQLLSWLLQMWEAADTAREPHAKRWNRYYRMHRGYIEKKPGDWRSRVFIPMAFWIIETITPRLVAQLPKFTANPMGPEDVYPAKRLELLLEWAASESDLYVEIVKAFKSALKYGTGIIKTYFKVEKKRRRVPVPLMVPQYAERDVPILDENGMQAYDMNGQPMFQSETIQVGEVYGGTHLQRETYTAYEGPASECVDLFNFWVAPEADDIQKARYVIHRCYKELSWVKQKGEEGIYQLPEGMEWEDLVSEAEDPNVRRLQEVELGIENNDPTRRPVEMLEFWLDDGRVIVLANRRAVIRVQENPFDHGQKPFVRIVDYLQEHEFYGMGEIEAIADMQDVNNAIVNARIDNLRLLLNSMFAVNTAQVEDMADLQMRPGGYIRIKGDMKPNEVIERLDLGDVTASAFTEVQNIETTVEKITGVSAYQMGLDSPTFNNTATGTAIIQEQGASRFGLKAKLAELIGLRPLGQQYASILQQFTTEEKQVRLNHIDPMTGMPLFWSFTPDSIQGGVDIDIQSESTSQTQTMRVEQKMNLLSLMAQYNPVGVMPALESVIEAMGEKDTNRYMYGQPTPAQPGQMPGPMNPMMDPSMGMQQPMGAPMVNGLTSNQMLNPFQQMAALGGNAAAGTGGQMRADQITEARALAYDQAASLPF